MPPINVRSWESFEKKRKEIRQAEISAGRSEDFLFRGIHDSTLPLATTLERVGLVGGRISEYYRMIPRAKAQIETFTGLKWDIPTFPKLEESMRNHDTWPLAFSQTNRHIAIWYISGITASPRPYSIGADRPMSPPTSHFNPKSSPGPAGFLCTCFRNGRRKAKAGRAEKRRSAASGRMSPPIDGIICNRAITQCALLLVMTFVSLNTMMC
jgi:hypothetical protein